VGVALVTVAKRRNVAKQWDITYVLPPLTLAVPIDGSVLQTTMYIPRVKHIMQHDRQHTEREQQQRQIAFGDEKISFCD